MLTRSKSPIRAGRLYLILLSISVPFALWLLAGMSMAADDLPRLIAELRSDDLSHRISAAAALEKLGPRAAPATQALVATLRDENADARAAAARALHAIGPEATPAVPALVELLEDRRSWVRDQAAETLAAIGEPATPLVVDTLKTGPPIARAGAALVLGRMGPSNKAALPALFAALRDPGVRVRATAAAELAKFGEAAVPALARAVVDDDATVVVAAAEGLQAIHARPAVAVPALAQALAKPESRAAVVLALQEYGTDAQTAVPALVRVHPVEQRYHNDAVIKALKQIGPARPEDAGALRALLENDGPFVRALAAEELAKLPATAETTDALHRVLRDPVALVRVHAARAIWLANHDSANILAALASGFDDGDYDTTRLASETLALIGEPAIPTLRQLRKHKLSKARRWVEDALGEIKTDAADHVPNLIESLHDHDSRVCNLAAAALGKIGPRAAPAVPDLVQVVDEKRLDFETFVRAVRGIGPAAKAAKEPLISALDSRDEQARWHAFTALCRIGSGDESIAEVAVAAVRDGKVRPQWGLRQLAGLGSAATEAVPLALEYLQNGERFVRSGAAELIGNAGATAKAALPALRTALDDKDHSVRFESAVAIWRITGAPEPMVKALSRGFLEETGENPSNTYYFRRQALYRIEELGSGAVASVPVLALVLESDSADLAIHAAKILGKFGPAAAEAVPALTKLSQRTDWPRRKAGIDALEKITTDDVDRKGK
jgi:HEAT repeat protein